MGVFTKELSDGGCGAGGNGGRGGGRITCLPDDAQNFPPPVHV